MKHRVEVIDRTYAAVLAAKTPAERVGMILDCNRAARVFLAAGERLRHPDWPPDRIAEAVSSRIAGDLPHGAT
jgi:hypothetical protein